MNFVHFFFNTNIKNENKNKNLLDSREKFDGMVDII